MKFKILKNGGIIMNNKSVNNSNLAKVWRLISSSIFSDRGSAYYIDSFNSRVHDNYDITDATELILLSSRRTLL